MNSEDEHLILARALRTDIQAAPSAWLPRRAVLLDWLNAFLQRASAPDYQLSSTDATDLTALEDFLRDQKLHVA